MFDRKTNTLTNYSFHELEPSTTALTVIMAMTEDQNGTLWVATHGAGLLKFDREHRRFIRYRNDPSDPESLAQNRCDKPIYGSGRERLGWPGEDGGNPFRDEPSAV